MSETNKQETNPQTKKDILSDIRSRLGWLSTITLLLAMNTCNGCTTNSELRQIRQATQSQR